MSLLENIRGPRDLDELSIEQLEQLAAEVREFLVREVSKTGGHLGPNLGVVELTIAMHKVFRSPRDAFVFDTGHQSYVHKLLTGRQDFAGLRTEHGIAGYPQRSESEHDIVESSHASSSLSWADGISRSFAMTGQGDRHVVAVVGDGVEAVEPGQLDLVAQFQGGAVEDVDPAVVGQGEGFGDGGRWQFGGRSTGAAGGQGQRCHGDRGQRDGGSCAWPGAGRHGDEPLPGGSVQCDQGGTVDAVLSVLCFGCGAL